MNSTDIQLFRFIDINDLAEGNDFCCIGGEGKGSFAFWKFAEAYFDAAEVLYTNISRSGSKHWVKDSLVYPMCFMYRHFMELILKSLYIKYAKPDEASLSEYLKETSHYLNVSWKKLRPVLKKYRDRVKSNISLGDLGEYIRQMQQFDSGSMCMRYPIDNSSKPLLQYGRLDYENLHASMNDFYNSIRQLDYEIDNQMEGSFDEVDLKAFRDMYRSNKDVVMQYLDIVKEQSKEELAEFEISKGISLFDDFDNIAEKPHPEIDFFKSCTYNQKILIEELYYSGRDVSQDILTLPKSPYDAASDLVKMCLLHMKMDRLKFNEVSPTAYFNIVSKGPTGIFQCLSKAVEVLEWIDKTPKGR